MKFRSVALLALLVFATHAHAASEDPDRLYRPAVAPGDIASATAEIVAPDGRRVPLRLTYPTTGTALPVILFSHGAYSSGKLYDPLARQWAARGYVVVQPTHPDSTLLGGVRGQPTGPEVWVQRVADCKATLDQFDAVVAAAPGLGARVDRTRVVAAGHSFGGGTAAAMVGAPPAMSDARVTAAMLLSAPGPIPGRLTGDDFAQVKRPMLVTVGTNDLGSFDKTRGWDWRADAYAFATPGEKFLLTVKDMDHYGGGMMGPDPMSKPDAEALAAMLATTTAFLDAELRHEARARTWLTGGELAKASDGRATLQSK